MTSLRADSDASQGASSPGVRETADGGLGAALVAQADLDAITALIQGLPTVSLLEQLDAAVAALDSSDPIRARRRVGWFGRLMGRESVAQAQGDRGELGVRVGLSSALALADVLSAQLVKLPAAADGLQRQLGLLDATVSDTRGSGPADDVSARRLVHLDLIAASWTATLSGRPAGLRVPPRTPSSSCWWTWARCARSISRTSSVACRSSGFSATRFGVSLAQRRRT
jgi:hypothetical protein